MQMLQKICDTSHYFVLVNHFHIMTHPQKSDGDTNCSLLFDNFVHNLWKVTPLLLVKTSQDQGCTLLKFQLNGRDTWVENSKTWNYFLKLLLPILIFLIFHYSKHIFLYQFEVSVLESKFYKVFEQSRHLRHW